MSHFKRTQAKYVKKPYRVDNWSEYEAGLRNRGSLTVWICVEEVKAWGAPQVGRRKRGRQKKYSDHAIETALTVRMVFHLALRQAEGFLGSLFGLLNLRCDVPDHTTISRRARKLGQTPLAVAGGHEAIHLLVDSSGLKIHVGHLRKPPKHRDWRKLHIGVDALTGEVVACDLTSKSAGDASRIPALLGQIDRPIASVRGDTAYDDSAVYRAVETHKDNRSPRVLIPPKKGAQIYPKSVTTRERNRNIRSRARVGKRKWHTQSGYSIRSKVETTFYRYKTIIGSAMRSRILAGQRVEARIGCKILNMMTALGMPDGHMVG
jgi:hypothetical protein